MNSGKAEISALFETPLIVDEMPGYAKINAELKERVLDRQRRSPEGLVVSNRFGWHSDKGMLDWGGPAARRLCDHAVALATGYTEDIGSPEGGRYVWVPEIWANVSGRGAMNQYHCHAGTIWAAVYYVDDGYQGSADRSLGGELELEDPRMPMLLMNGPDLRMRWSDAIHEPEVRIRPAAGRMLLFPGWLRHGVRPFSGSGTRISIAINLTAVLLR